MRRAIEKFERDWQYDISQICELVEASPRANGLLVDAAPVWGSDLLDCSRTFLDPAGRRQLLHLHLRQIGPSVLGPIG